MKQNNILEELKDCFKNTPEEKIKEDWDNLKKYDEVGPSAHDYL